MPFSYMICVRTARLSVWATFILIVVSHCGCDASKGNMAGISVEGPNTIARGEAIETNIAIIYSAPNKSYRDKKVRVNIECDNKDIDVRPSEAEVRLDARGNAKVPIYIRASSEAMPGDRTMVITTTLEGGTPISERFSITIK